MVMNEAYQAWSENDVASWVDDHYLKADDRTRNIPVIFISALGDVFDKVKALKAASAKYLIITGNSRKNCC